MTRFTQTWLGHLPIIQEVLETPRTHFEAVETGSGSFYFGLPELKTEAVVPWRGNLIIECVDNPKVPETPALLPSGPLWLTNLLRDTEEAHKAFEAAGGVHPDGWPAWYSSYMADKLQVNPKLLETVVDVADTVFYAREHGTVVPEDSREVVQTIIDWAEEFQRDLAGFDYNNQPGYSQGNFRSYIEDIDNFTNKRIKEEFTNVNPCK